MATKKFITYIQLLTLLLLTGYSVAGKSVGTVPEFHLPSKENLTQNESGVHKNMLQQHVVQVNVVPEHFGKQFPSGFGILPFGTKELLLVQPSVPTKTILQDLDRCESVSRLLFPYHIFW